MKIAATILVLLACTASTWAQIGSRLTLETMDVDGMLRNAKLVRKQIDCVLERGRCDINGRDLKGSLAFFDLPAQKLIRLIIRHL